MELSGILRELRHWNSFFTRVATQCSGTSPSHSTPDGFEPHVGVEAARDRLLDNRLLLLVQQLDLAAFGANEATDQAIMVVEERGDLALLKWWGIQEMAFA